MRCHSVRRCAAFSLAVFLLWLPPQRGAATVADAWAAPVAAPEDYPNKLKEYLAAREAYDNEAKAYWSSIADKRRLRTTKRRNNEEILVNDYVLTQPPTYSGPPKPVDPSAPVEAGPLRRYVPVVADFLQAAVQEFNFVPQQPRDEMEYKRAYAKVALAAGLTEEQAVRVYGFESGGEGKYDVQAGLEYANPGAQAISTALGYNQLLATNSVELLAEKGDQFIETLQTKAAALSGTARETLLGKIAAVKTMVAFSRNVPDDWSEHEKLASTAKGLGTHALNLDLDVGPLLQTQKLLDSVVFARAKGYARPLSAAELEMMNLTGDGNGFDMVTMPSAWRDQVPTSNFFQQDGYVRNPVAIRSNVVAKLQAAIDAKMTEESKLQGAKDLAAAFSE